MSEQERLALELHRPKRKIFPTRAVEVKGLHETWQADLVEMQHLKRWNRGFRYLLTVIDIFSKRAFVEPCKAKNAENVMQAMRNIITRAKAIPKHLQTDRGTEFFNVKFTGLMKKHKINHFHTYSPLKASVVERFNRTFKNIMYRFFTHRNTLNWIDSVQELVKEYNRTPHRTIGMKPIQTTKRNEKKVLQNIRKYQRKRLKGVKINLERFHVGDIVRLSRYKGTFEKGYTPNWTEEVFKVVEVISSHPRTYKVVDMLNTPIHGTFYTQELQKTTIPNYGRIEKVLQRKTLRDGTKMIRVKWKNYDSRFNQWIPLTSSKKL